MLDKQSMCMLRNRAVKRLDVFNILEFHRSSRIFFQILKDFSLKVPLGKRVALVGESGCGKSTVVKLISRFYDPQTGSVSYL